MNIDISLAGKRYNREWIFRKANLHLTSGNAYAITGPNGSGKTTLLQCIAGMLQLSEGQIKFLQDKGAIKEENVYKHIAFCAPYFEVIEEMTLNEFFQFHFQFKPLIQGLTYHEVISAVSLEHATGKQIRYFSSGMKQRVKLAQAIFTQTNILLLDEPCSNLDDDGISLYHNLINSYCKERLVIVCSNDPAEYVFCNKVISINTLKQATS